MEKTEEKSKIFILGLQENESHAVKNFLNTYVNIKYLKNAK